MTTLHERIEAAVRERMAVAQAATPGPWHVDPDALIVPHLKGWAEGSSGVTAADWTHEQPLIWRGVLADDDAAFIAANDPARILRDCERDLKVLERHKRVVAEGWGHGALVCELTWMASDGWPIDWPCDDIRDLAEAYGIAEDTS